MLWGLGYGPLHHTAAAAASAAWCMGPGCKPARKVRCEKISVGMIQICVNMHSLEGLHCRLEMAGYRS